MQRTGLVLLIVTMGIAAGACFVEPAPAPVYPAGPPRTVEPTPAPVYTPPTATMVQPQPPPTVVVQPAPTPTPRPAIVVQAPPPPPAQIRVQVQGVIRSGTQPPAYAPPPPTVVGYAPRDLYVTNDMGQTICRLYVSPSGESGWGDDVLGDQTLPAGSQVVLAVDGGVAAWDLLAEDCGGNTIYEERGRGIPANGLWSVRGAATAVAVVGPPRPAIVTTIAPPPPVVVGYGRTPTVVGPPPPTIVGAAPVATADFRTRAGLTALAVAYWLGAGQEDLDELRRAAIGEGACGFIDNDELDQMCSIAISDMGACSFFDSEDLQHLCQVGFEGEDSCGFIRDTNLQYFCRSAFQGERLCSYITDARIQQICWQM
jgi:hypothetical protein